MLYLLCFTILQNGFKNQLFPFFFLSKSFGNTDKHYFSEREIPWDPRHYVSSAALWSLITRALSSPVIFFTISAVISTILRKLKIAYFHTTQYRNALQNTAGWGHRGAIIMSLNLDAINHLRITTTNKNMSVRSRT